LRTFGVAPALHRRVSDWLSVATGTAVDGGPRRWGGVAGRVVMTRSAAPARFRDLIAFTWTDGAWRRMIAIGAFGPYDRAVATLREVVGHRPATPPTRELVPAGGVAMVETPRWLRLLCGRDLRPACPTRMPAPNGALTLAQADARSLDLVWGAHLTVSAGPRRARPVIALGRRHWTTPPGRLSLGARACFGNHACYAWDEGDQSYLVSLHAWRPLAQTVAVLGRMIRSISGR
jgi:hypothetical protein